MCGCVQVCAGRNASRCCYCTVLSLFIRKRREKDGGIRKREQSVWRALCIHACATRSAQCTPDHGSSAFHSPSLSSSAGLPPLCASQHSPFFKEMKIFSVVFKECVNLSTHRSQAVCTSITKKRKNMQISPRPLSHFPCVVSEASSATLVEKAHPCVVRRCSYITIDAVAILNG